MNLYVGVLNYDGRDYRFGTIAYVDKFVCRQETTKFMESEKIRLNNKNIGMVIHELKYNQ